MLRFLMFGLLASATMAKPLHQPIKQVDQTIEQSNDQSVDRSIKESMKQVIKKEGVFLSETDPNHPLNQAIKQSNLDPSYDCPLRLLTVEMAGFIQPRRSYDQSIDRSTNWTKLAWDAMQMDSCNSQSIKQSNKREHRHLRAIKQSIDQSIEQEKLKDDMMDKIYAPSKSNLNAAPVKCALEIFVDQTNGNNDQSIKQSIGSINQSFKTIDAALQYTRQTRASQSNYGPTDQFCITIKEGVYYLGSINQSNKQSNKQSIKQSINRGAISLSYLDSYLTISAYQTDKVVLSGGVQMDLNWQNYQSNDQSIDHSVKQSNSQNPTTQIWKAKLPANLDLTQFNEFYANNWRAVKAKYPNGDPAITGLYTNPTGFNSPSLAQSWQSPRDTASVNVEVKTPFRANATFPTFQLGIGGTADVFEPKRNFWSSSNPPQGNHYVVPSGLIPKPEAFPNISKWSNPSTGEIHAFHGGMWGSWVFPIDTVDMSNPQKPLIEFGVGGFQEARGSGSGNAFSVMNIFEELDAEFEYFVDKVDQTIYFIPNDTIRSSDPSNNQFVASQMSTILSITGSSDQPIQSILIDKLIFTHTASTYLNKYEVPSGGDWAIHPGGTIYLSKSSNVVVRDCLFTQIANNGVAILGKNIDTELIRNEFAYTGDSGVIVVGESCLFDCTPQNDELIGQSITPSNDLYNKASNHPLNTKILNNLFHETGAYIKQSSPVFIALSYNQTINGNLIFNIPRAGINVNDGFGGGHSFGYNVLFNTVRETSDHGPINTWDRQPYLMVHQSTNTSEADSQPTLIPLPSEIHHNTLFNNYNSFYPIDHDDGSCFWVDHSNVQIYGAKKNYLGHSKTDHSELYIFPDLKDSQGVGVCIADQGVQPYISGWNETWTNNTCILKTSNVVYNLWYCDTTDLFIPFLANNQFYVPGDAVFPCAINGKDQSFNLTTWQSYGQDLGSTVGKTPEIDVIVDMARKLIMG